MRHGRNAFVFEGRCTGKPSRSRASSSVDTVRTANPHPPAACAIVRQTLRVILRTSGTDGWSWDLTLRRVDRMSCEDAFDPSSQGEALLNEESLAVLIVEGARGPESTQAEKRRKNYSSRRFRITTRKD